VIANVNLGRVGLSSSYWTGALEAYESALSLIGEAAVAGEDTQTARLRVQALLGCGLAHARQGAPDQAVRALELASAAAAASGEAVLGRHVVVVLARVLWAIGGDEQRSEARLQLLEAVTEAESGLPHLPIIATLGAMAVVASDHELLDAALAEVVKLPIHQQLELDPDGDVPELQAAQCLLGGDGDGAVALGARMAHASPSAIGPRTDLATRLLQSGRSEGAAGVLGLGTDRSAVASVAAGERAFADAERAVRAAPWDVDAWRALAVSCAA